MPTVIKKPAEWIVWLDLDDTLWDFNNNSLHALGETYARLGLDRYWPSVDQWRDDYHRVNDRLWTELAAGKIDQPYLRRQRFFEPFTQAGMNVELAESLTAIADAYYLERLGLLPTLVPGARELLERLKNRGFKTGILSNGFKEVQYNKIESAGIGRLIDFVVLSDSIMVNKPDRRLFDHALSEAGALPDKAIMIGDNSDTDIAGAIGAGWRLAVWFNPNHRPPGQALVSAISRPCSIFVVDKLDQIVL